MLDRWRVEANTAWTLHRNALTQIDELNRVTPIQSWVWTSFFETRTGCGKNSDALFSNHTELLQESQVVFKVPVFCDAAIGDSVDIRRDKIDFLTCSLDVLETPREVAVKT